MRDFTGIGPHKLECTNSNTLNVRVLDYYRNPSRVCFAKSQFSRLFFIRGSFGTFIIKPLIER